MPRQTAIHYALLALTIGISFFLNLGGAPLFDLDEGAFSEASREMFVRGDFISPFVNGLPRFDKPVLIHWLQAASMSLFGVTPFAFRLPSALAASLWVLLTYAFVARVIERDTALRAAMMLAAALGIMIIGRAATADALLNLWLAAAMFGIYLYFLERKKRWILLTHAAMGLGFLTKGPVALLIPGAVGLIFFAMQRELPALMRAAFYPPGLILLIGIPLPWYILQYQAQGMAFIDGFFGTHNVERFSGSMEGHAGSLFYYLPIALLLALPFTTPLLRAVRELPKQIKSPLGLYLWLWFGFVLVFFSLSGTKLPHYLNYGMTAAMILAALALPMLNSDRLGSRVLALLPALLFFALLAPLPCLLPEITARLPEGDARALLIGAESLFPNGYFEVFFLLAASSLALMFVRSLALAPSLIGLALAGNLALALFFLPALGAIQQGPIAKAAAIASEQAAPYVMWRVNTPSYSVHSAHVQELREPRAGDLVFTRTNELANLPAHHVLMNERGYSLVRLQPSEQSHE
ncbi:MAG: glycosyltransferase family 39 protein [Halothiobacillaceae bacterium]|nr:glycosyltransferase family 39 protein [Halothiobacillaceae bacterium]